MADVWLVRRPDLAAVPRSQWPVGLRQSHSSEYEFALTTPSLRAASILVDNSAVCLLELFRDPTPVTRAVHSYSVNQNLEPVEVLEHALPLLQLLVDTGHLIVVGPNHQNPAAPEVKGLGLTYRGWEIVRCVRRLEDSSVYEVARGDERGALKVIHEGARWQKAALVNETYVLQNAAIRQVPRVLDKDLACDEPYIVVDWRNGEHVTKVANEIRGQPMPRSRLTLLKLLAAVARAYADLHSAGLLHGDVQPRNILATLDDSPTVSIIDFGFGDIALIEPSRPFRPRGGVEGYQAPELIVNGDTKWNVTPASEQYAIGCLLYELATGAFPFERTMNASAFRATVGRVRPRSFHDVGTRGWEELEVVILKALASQVSQRYQSVSQLASCLEALVRRSERLAAPVASSPQPALSTLVGPADLDRLTPPLASVNYGASGLAYTYYRRAQLERSGLLLATALAWAEGGRLLIKRPDAFENQLLGISRGTVAGTGLYHSAAGTHLVELLAARANAESFLPALKRMLKEVAQAPENADIVSGRAGLLLACAHALSALFSVEHPSVQELIRVGDSLLLDLGTREPRVKDPVPGQSVAYLGIAHGWAGVAFACVSWCRIRDKELPRWVRSLLDELIDQTADAGDDMARWPVVFDGDSKNAWPGWCHGSAGHAILYCEVSRLLGGDYIKLAEAAALHATSSRTRNSSLCCGTAGIGYADLSLYRRTGSERWLAAAAGTANRSVAEPLDPALSYSLYKGPLGLQMLRADLSEPSSSVFPLFEVENHTSHW